MNQEITIKIPMVGHTIAAESATSSAETAIAPPPDLAGQMTIDSMTAVTAENIVAPPPENAVFSSGASNDETLAPGPEFQFPMNNADSASAPGPEEVMAETQIIGWAPEPSASDLMGTAESVFSEDIAPPPDLDAVQAMDKAPMPETEAVPVTKSTEKKSTAQSRAKK